MNFFRSGLFGDAETRSVALEDAESTELGDSAVESLSGGWNIGSFVKTIASKSGEVLQAYQRDLQEFGVGLKRETEAVAEVTVHVVKDLPHSLETGAVVAQESLETVGQTLEDFGSSVWRGTAELISTVKEAVQRVDEEAAVNSSKSNVNWPKDPPSASGQKYNRYEAQVNAMQRDSSTYCDEPEDEQEYESWRSSFDLTKRNEEIGTVLKDNVFLQELQARIVPLVVDNDIFWTRYFYRLHKLQQAENARAYLVKRATLEEDEELTWDDEEEPNGDATAFDLEQIVPASQEGQTVVDNVAQHDKEIEGELVLQAPISSAVPTAVPALLEDSSKLEHSSTVQELPAATHDSEETVSEGSTGSDWLVVQEEKDQGLVESSSHKSTADSKDKRLPVVSERERMTDTGEPELEDIGEFSLEDNSKSASETSRAKADVKSVADDTEDWGDWE